jgi:hypothetical protein
MSIETLKGLTLLESLSEPVPATVSQYFRDNLATGTGPYGSFTVMDFLGTAAGGDVTNMMLQVPVLINTMNVTVLQGLYNDMLATVSGTYGPNTGPVTIPAGPAAGVYATGDLAFTTGLIPAAQAEIANLIATYPVETGDLNNVFDTISAQIFREAVNQAKTGLNYDDLPSGSQSGALSFASSLAQYGQDNTPYNSAVFLNTVAQFGNLPGQAIIGCLREGRNYQSLNEAGILSTNFAVPSTYPGDSPGGNANVLTPLPPVQPPVIPAPPQNQPPTNSISTNYSVDEAVARYFANASTNSDIRSLPPPVDPGPMLTPPPTAPTVRPAFSPPRSVDGPTIRLNRSGSSALPGQLTVITADVFFAAMNDYPIGTRVPYTISGIDPSKVSVMTVQSVSSDPGIPLDGTFEISTTRQGYFGIVVDPAWREDVIITIDVEGAKTYLGITPQDPVNTQGTIEFLGFFENAPPSSKYHFGDAIESLEAGKVFWIQVRASTIREGDSYDGTVVVESGPAFEKRFSMQVLISPYLLLTGLNQEERDRIRDSSTYNASLLRVPATAIAEPGLAKITITVDGRYSNSTTVNVVPPQYSRDIVFTSAARQSQSQYYAAGNSVTQLDYNEIFSIIVTGPPNTPFDWTGFDASGTSATDATGRCVFPNIKAPDTAYKTFATVKWPDGEIIAQFVNIG